MERKVYAVVNQKGGVAKTTTTHNTGAALANLGAKVLMIDLDPQGSLSKCVGRYFEYKEDKPVILEENKTIYGVLKGATQISNVIQRVNNYDVVPANILMASADMDLCGVIGRESLLDDAIKSLETHYDYVLIDCPPSLGLLTLNALTAAEQVIIPIVAEYMPLEGTSQLMDSIRMVKKKYNPQLSLAGIVMTRVNLRCNLHKEAIELVHNTYPNNVFRTEIPNNIKVAEAPAHQQDIFRYDSKCAGAKAYTKLAKEIIERNK